MPHRFRPPQDLARRIPRWAGIGLFVYASMFTLRWAEAFLVPVIFAFLLSMVFAPIRRGLERVGLSTWLSSMLIVFLLLCAFMGLVTALVVPVNTWVDNAPRIEHKIQRKVHDLSQSMSQLLGASQRLQKLTDTAPTGNDHEPTVHVDKDKSVVKRVALLAPSFVAQLVFTFVLLFFLLAAGDMFYEKLVYVMPTFRDKRRTVNILHAAEAQLSRYLATVTAINCGMGVVVGLMTFAYGMPSPLLFGVAAFVLNFVPYLGALMVIVATAAVAFLSFGWFGWALIVPGTYWVLSLIEGQVVTPMLIGRRLRINTVVVFLAVTFWAWMWSIVGMIVAVPILVAVRTVCEHIEELDHISAFLSQRHGEQRPDE